MKIDENIIQVLSDALDHDEWDIAFHIHDWTDSTLRSKHGAWIRSIVQALRRLQDRGLVSYFWVSHGEGVSGTRVWFKRGCFNDD